MNLDPKIVIENRLLPSFRRAMAKKYDMSSQYIVKAIKGELPTKKIAKMIVSDYEKFQTSISDLAQQLDT